MGEIADALRRARGQVGLRPDSASESPAREPAPPRPPAAAPVRPSAAAPASVLAMVPPKPAQRLDSFVPTSGAVILEGPDAEACRALALSVRAALEQRGGRSLAVVSAERGDGKSSVACNLAIALATLSLERDVALVDLDLRKPALAGFLSVPRVTGIEEVLQGRATLDSARVEVQAPMIDVYPVRTATREAHELLVLPQMAAMIAELERRYSIVIVDTPPAPMVPDASLILRHVGSCAAVVRAGKTRLRSFRKLVKCLPRERLMGWIVNGERSVQFGYREYYYGEGSAGAEHWERGAPR